MMWVNLAPCSSIVEKKYQTKTNHSYKKVHVSAKGRGLINRALRVCPCV